MTKILKILNFRKKQNAVTNNNMLITIIHYIYNMKMQFLLMTIIFLVMIKCKNINELKLKISSSLILDFDYFWFNFRRNLTRVYLCRFNMLIYSYNVATLNAAGYWSVIILIFQLKCVILCNKLITNWKQCIGITLRMLYMVIQENNGKKIKIRL